MSYLLKLKSLCNHLNDQSELEESIINHIEHIFNNPSLFDFYNVLRKYVFKSDKAKVIQAWLALLSGNNLHLTKIMHGINAEELGNQYLSLYYDLKALSSISGSPDERLAYNDMALKTIEDQTDSFFYANVFLTRGQIYSALRSYRKAADYFDQAYVSFFSTDMMFPAAVAMTNALLNWYKIGAFNQLINRAHKVKLMISQFNQTSSNYWDILKLPIGMTYLLQLKTDLAEEMLVEAHQAIDDLNLFHMHGFSELSLFSVYHYQQDINKQRYLYQRTKKLFENMHYPFMRVILIYFDLLMDHKIETSDMQFVESFYEQTKHTGDPLAFQLLFYFSLHHETIKVCLDDVEEIIKQLRYHGDLGNLAVLLLELAEYYSMHGQKEAMYVILEEVVNMYREDLIKFSFYRFPLSIWKYIQEMDPSIKPNVSKRSLLTPKEQEIMSYIEKGLTNKEIAETIYVSLGTVKWHINNIYSKLDVSSRVEAINALK